MTLHHVAGRNVLAMMIMVLASPSWISAQERPDVSGTWVATTEAPAGIAAAPSAILGPRFALRLEGDTLTVIRPVRDENIAAHFKLDGSRTSFKVPGRMCEGDSEFIEAAAWDGDVLVLTGFGRVPPGGGGAPSQTGVKRLLRLENSETLIVESTMVQAGNTRAVATVYKRSQAALEPRAGAIKGTPATIAQVTWVPGFWSGVNGNLLVEERWTPAASGAILGLGRVLRGNLMTSFEFLCIAERDGSLVYTAMPDGRTTPTHFTLTSISADSAVFENPAHDFPKTIRYHLRPDGALETTISGTASQRTISLVLQRQP